MITPTLRFIVVADCTKYRGEFEVLGTISRDTNDAHVVARHCALAEPGRRFFICEVVGFHEAAVRPPSFTAFGDRLMKCLPRFVGQSEDMLS